MEFSQRPSRAEDSAIPLGRPRRRWDRHDVATSVNVTTVVNGERTTFSGQACDISIGGLRLFLTREIDAGTSLQLEFLLPYYSMELVVRGVVRNRSGFTHGVEFISPTPEQQEMIDRTCHVLALLR
jgi:c-di-GMP-binding flagellar brake protein YcgR